MKLVIYGVPSTAVQSHYDFATDSDHQVVAFTVERAALREPELLGLPVVPFEEVETLYPPQDHLMFIAVYFDRVNQLRKAKFEAAKAKGYSMASNISSWAIVRPFTSIGADSFIMPGAVVGHDAVVGDHGYLAIRATMLAGSKLDSQCAIGAGVVIHRNTREKGVYTIPEPSLQPLPSDKLANTLFKVQA